MKKIEFFKHCIDERDMKNVNRVLRSLFLTTGKEVEEFEKSFSAYSRRKHTVGVTSGTAALHLSLTALGITQGDEVITTPMSFCATANAILQAGAIPVFVDVEEETGNLNADLIESSITKRTRAILPVHLYGQMCDMKKIRKIADTHNLKIIEDAAHSIESSRDGVRVGELSETACYSFYATKNITSGEGGAISTDIDELAELFIIMRLHGIDSSAAYRYTKYFRHWDMPLFGWKYNMDNIQAALLKGQLERIEDLWQARDFIWKLYEEELDGFKGIRLLKTLSGTRHARHLFTVQVPADRRDPLLKAMQSRGVGIAVNYRPIHLLTFYRKKYGYQEGDYPVAESIGDCTISLPLYPSLSPDEVRYVTQVLKEEL
jgi:dTDP-4-amino-4,6-dideoxygalactose transaminase